MAQKELEEEKGLLSTSRRMPWYRSDKKDDNEDVGGTETDGLLTTNIKIPQKEQEGEEKVNTIRRRRISWFSFRHNSWMIDSGDDYEVNGNETDVNYCQREARDRGIFIYWKQIMKRIFEPSNLIISMFAIGNIVIIIGVVIAFWISRSPDHNNRLSSSSRSSSEARIEYLKEQSSLDNIYFGAVATDHPTCSNIGLSILKEQLGNAVDAAIATALCLGVVNPSSSGLGGGNFMMVHMQNNNRTEFIDSRETAPLASFTEMFNNDTALASLIGGHAVAVWGELRGLELAHKRYGSVPWHLLVEPSISLAENGIVVSKYLAFAIQSVSTAVLEQPSGANLKNFLLSTTTSTSTTKESTSPSYLKQGDVLRQPILANTLRQVAKDGSKVLYEGPIAEAMIKELREEHNSIITMEDLMQYTPQIREPLVVSHKIMGGDFTFVGAPPPSSGGGAVLGILRMLSGYYLTTNLVVQRNALTQHLLIEAFKHAFAIRMSLSDPDYSTTTTTTTTTTGSRNKAMEAIYDLISSDYMEYLRINYTLYDRVLPLQKYGGPKWSLLSNNNGYSNSSSSNSTTSSTKILNHDNPDRRRRMRLLNYLEDHGTTHFSIVDKDRNAVSFSSTVNTEFGSGIWLTSAGIILNNQMDDFATPGRPNTFGLAPAEANYIQPGKRPLSSMSPTMVFYNLRSASTDDNSNENNMVGKKLFLVLGASGGPRIITAVVQVVINYMIFGMSLKDAVAHPRVHDQLLYNNQPSTLYDENVIEAGYGVSETTKHALSRRGHALIPTSYTGTCQAVAIDIETNKIEAVSDPRKGGVPAGY